MLRSRIHWAAVAALVVWAGAASAAEEKSGPLSWVDVNALVSTRYTYSFDRAVKDRIPARVIDQKDNTFTIDTASIFVSRMEEDEDFGFGIALDFGDAAEYTAASKGELDDSDEFELREAFATYDLPWADISVKAGKFVTLLGYEVLKTNAAFNHNISHSIMFGYAIPFTHTGFLVSAPIGEIVSVDIGVVNGWDNLEDNNSGKTLLAGLGVDPLEELSFYAAGTFGPEQPAKDDDPSSPGAGSKRSTLTVNGVWTVTDQLSLVGDFAIGNETDLIPDGSGRDDAQWYGFAGYIVFDLDDHWSFALRGEVFNTEGTPTAFASGKGTSREVLWPLGDSVTIWEFTPTVAFRLNDHLMVRAEYRHDEASDRIFAKANGFSQHGWDTLAAEVLVGF